MHRKVLTDETWFSLLKSVGFPASLVALFDADDGKCEGCGATGEEAAEGGSDSHMVVAVGVIDEGGDAGPLREEEP